MTYFRVKNWASFQHYKDRNPPWIKLHREILTSRTWVMLDDEKKALAVACMLLAAAHENKVPADPDYVMRVAYLKKRPDLSALVKTDFIEIIEENGSALSDASKTEQGLAEFRPETETETEKRIKDSVEFTAFWTEYPKKVAKPDARKHFAKVAKEFDAIMAGLNRAKQSQEWRNDGGKYIPHPHRFLEKRRWEDDYTPARADEPRKGSVLSL